MGSDLRKVKEVGDYAIYSHPNMTGDGIWFSVFDRNGNVVLGNRESLYDAEEDTLAMINSGGRDTDDFGAYWREKKGPVDPNAVYPRT